MGYPHSLLLASSAVKLEEVVIEIEVLRTHVGGPGGVAEESSRASGHNRLSAFSKDCDRDIFRKYFVQQCALFVNVTQFDYYLFRSSRLWRRFTTSGILL